MEKPNLNIGIGREPEPLTTEDVVVIDVMAGEQKNKQNVVVGDKITLICEHPKAKKYLEISKVQYVKNKKIKEAGMWYQLDDEGFIPFTSALANLLRFYKVATPEEIKGKVLHTTKDDEGFLVIKAL